MNSGDECRVGVATGVSRWRDPDADDPMELVVH